MDDAAETSGSAHRVVSILLAVLGSALCLVALLQARDGRGFFEGYGDWYLLWGGLALLDAVLLRVVPATGGRFVAATVAAIALIPLWLGIYFLLAASGAAVERGAGLFLVGAPIVAGALLVLRFALFIDRRLAERGLWRRLGELALFAVMLWTIGRAWHDTLGDYRLPCALGNMEGCHVLGLLLGERGQFDTGTALFEAPCASGSSEMCRAWAGALGVSHDAIQAREALGRWGRFDAVARGRCREGAHVWMCLDAARRASARGDFVELQSWLDLSCPEAGGSAEGCEGAVEIARPYPELHELMEAFLARAGAAHGQPPAR